MIMITVGTAFSQDSSGTPDTARADEPEGYSRTETMEGEEPPRAVNEGTTPVAVVLSGEGRRLTIFGSTELSSFDLRLETAAGVPVPSGMSVQLDGASTLELQLLPGTTRLKLGAHSSMRLEEIRPGGAGELRLSYGRFRVGVPASPGDYGVNHGTSCLILKTPHVRVKVGPGSDLAIDVLANAETGTTYTELTSIVGTARVERLAAWDEASGELPEAREVPPRTSVRSEAVENGRGLVFTEDFPSEVSSFWAPRGFEVAAQSGEALENRYSEAFAFVHTFYDDEAPAMVRAEPEPAEAAEERPQEQAEEPDEPEEAAPAPPETIVEESEAEHSDRTELRNGGAGLMGLGVVLAAAGFGVDYAADAFISSNVEPPGVPPEHAFLYAGGGFFLGGLITVIISQF